MKNLSKILKAGSLMVAITLLTVPFIGNAQVDSPYTNLVQPQTTASPSIPSNGAANGLSSPTTYVPTSAAAANPTTNSNVATLKSPLQNVNSISDLILTFMKVVSYIAVIFGVLMIMYVGMQFVLAQGKPEEIKKRSNQLLWVVVGIGVILGARILVTVIINTLEATGTINPAIITNARNGINSQ